MARAQHWRSSESCSSERRTTQEAKGKIQSRQEGHGEQHKDDNGQDVRVNDIYWLGCRTRGRHLSSAIETSQGSRGK